jgi:hypothetical protein
MPFYAYSSDSGEYEERFFKMGEAPRSITLDNGCVLERDFSAEHNPRKAGGGWPIECIASGVSPQQAQELRDFYEKSGCPTEVKNNGNVVYRDSEHRKRALKLRGFRDYNSFG